MLDRLKSFLGDIRRPGSTTTTGLNSVVEDRPISAQVAQPPSEATAAATAQLPEFGTVGVSFAVDDVVPPRTLYGKDLWRKARRFVPWQGFSPCRMEICPAWLQRGIARNR
jgi:hypothetical protein